MNNYYNKVYINTLPIHSIIIYNTIYKLYIIKYNVKCICMPMYYITLH